MIREIREQLAGSNPNVPLAIGDDAAVLTPRRGYQTVLTTDGLIEGIHFDLRYTPLSDLGWKALAVNLSDVAAMCADPVCAVISLALPCSWDNDKIEQLYEGLKACSDTYHCPIVGGDITRSPGPVMLTLTVLGEVLKDQYIRRSGAEAGDLVCVSGDLGGALAGFRTLHHNPEHAARTEAVEKFLRPHPRLELARTISSRLSVHAAIDISDGLASEIHHICRESNVGAVIEAELIPVHPEAAELSAQTAQDMTRLALSSGEEYELLFTIPPQDGQHLHALQLQVPVHVIGRIREPALGVILSRNGHQESLTETGWDHFRS